MAFNLKKLESQMINIYEGTKTVNGKQIKHPRLKGIGCELPIIRHGRVIRSGYKDIITYIDNTLYPDVSESSDAQRYNEYLESGLRHHQDLAFKELPDCFFPMLLQKNEEAQ
jgi:hypothetical protein